MGYDLHITRNVFWADEQDHAKTISLEEWLNYIKNDPELELSEEYWIKVPGSETDSHPAPGYCKWKNHPTGFEPYFLYWRGSIDEKNPDEFTIRKMIAIANQLNAYVQGDDGEIYDLSSNNEIGVRDADTTTLRIVELQREKSQKHKTKPWWKFW